MGIVMIKCPRTGRPISTGMTADRETFRCSAVFFARTHCPICETNHQWFAREAWVDEPRPTSFNALMATDDLREAAEHGRTRKSRSVASWPVDGRAVMPRSLRFG